jgi:hypothetical protein
MAGAFITIEAAEAIGPGATGLVRLHPMYWDAWEGVRAGQRITMLEGLRIVGVAEVLEVVPPG